jgi:subtilisin family serine protease
LPQTRLVAVDAFGIENGEEQTDVVRIVAALDELARRNVRVVNLSFSGPPNEVLEQAIQRAQSRGMVLVAAVGNGGPNAEPSYPAGYPGVIAVTAVDREMRIYPRATRGDYVVLAAPGVGVPTAKAGGGEAVRSGTSFAVPFVTAAVARLIARQPTTNETQVAEALTSAARDIGKPGRDPEFGWGLLQTASLCEQPPNEPDRDVAGGSRRQGSGERSLSRRDE